MTGESGGGAVAESLPAADARVRAGLRGGRRPVVFVHSPYAASKTLGKWNPGTVMYDFFLDELASSKR